MTGAISLNDALASAVSVTNLSTGSGDITFHQTGGGAVSFGTVSTSSGGVTLTDDSGDLTVGTSVTTVGSGNIQLTTTTSGNVVLTGTTTAAGQQVTINSVGNINGAGLVTADSLVLTAGAGIGNLTTLETAVSNLAANSGLLNLSLDNTSASLTIGGTGATATVSVAITTSGDLTVNSAVSAGAGSVTLTANNATGSALVLNAPVTGTASVLIQGGAGDDTFTGNSGAIGSSPLTVDGLGGDNTLIINVGTDVVWNLTGANSGNVASGLVAYSNIQNLFGGTGADDFVFGVGGSVGGIIDGQGGSDTLDYSAFATSVTVNFQTGTSTNTGGISNIENFTGGSANDTVAVTPLAVTRTINGGPHGANPPGDSLYFVGIGAGAVSVTTTSVTETGFAAVNYSNIETVVLVSASSADFQGTGGDDTVIVDYQSGSVLGITINGTGFVVDPAGVPLIHIDALGGRDSIVFLGSAGAETFNVQAHAATMTGQSSVQSTFEVVATNVEVDSIGGGGGADSATMHTSSVDDVFVGLPGELTRSTYGALYATDNSFYNVVYNMPVTAVDDSQVGVHFAIIYTSIADDSFVASATSAELSGAGALGQGPFDFTAQSFPNVIAYNDLTNPGNVGGHDATFSTSSVNDIFVGANSTYAELFSAVAGSEFNNIAYFFNSADATNADATAGVTHDAILYSSATTSDTFTATGATASLVGGGATPYSFSVSGFTSVSAFNQAGSTNGTATFTGIGDDDLFVGTETYALMTNGSPADAVLYRNVAYGFSTNTATALAGSQHTQASLLDSSGNNVFFGRNSQGSLLNNTVNNFHQVVAYSINGGVDTVDIANLDYIFIKIGNWAN